MSIKKLLYIGAISMLPMTALAQDATAGDIKINELCDVIVFGDNAWVEGNKIVFKPKKSAKNLATDAVSLIDRMNTGILYVLDGQIKSRNGQDVAIFINGVKADGMDLSTFWPKNVVRVEYFESSDDPRYAGYDRVVNFIMKEYVAGGLSKVNADQTFPNSGDYSIASKLVYKKMTYNAIFSGGYDRDHLEGVNRDEYYNDIWYEGEHYGLVERQQRSDRVSRNDNIYGGLNARYRTDKLTMTHSVGLQWTRNPESYEHGSLSYTPVIINTNSMYSRTRARSLSPVVSGEYTIIPGGKWSYLLNWNFSHSHNNTFSEYGEAVNDPVLTCISENIYKYSVSANFWYNIRNNMAVNFLLTEARQVSSAIYTGTTLSDQWQQMGQTRLDAVWRYVPVNNIFIKFSPSIELQDWNVDHNYKKTSWLPGVAADVNWSIGRKNALSFHTFYQSRPPVASMRNDLVLRETELRWLAGNPSMKPSQFQSYNIDWFTSPVRWLTSNISLGVNTENNENYIDYRSGGNAYDGVVGQYVSAGNTTEFMFFWSLSASFFDGKINIGNQLQYNYRKWDYNGSPKIGNWYVRPHVTWNFGNCSLSANYASPQKNGINDGREIVRYPYQCGLSFSYGNGNFNLEVGAENIFNKRITVERTFASGPYRYDEYQWLKGRAFSVSLTYTFDYGKKVTPGIEIGTQNVQTTTVLGSDRE